MILVIDIVNINNHSLFESELFVCPQRIGKSFIVKAVTLTNGQQWHKPDGGWYKHSLVSISKCLTPENLPSSCELRVLLVDLLVWSNPELEFVEVTDLLTAFWHQIYMPFFNVPSMLLSIVYHFPQELCCYAALTTLLIEAS